MTDIYDAIIIGSGPNGLSAALRLQQAGLSTAVYEQAATAGGACRTQELTLPGFKHDVGSSVHPMAISSPYFKTLPLAEHGLEWVHPEVQYAHPFLDGTALAAYRDIRKTAEQMGLDQQSYSSLFQQLNKEWDKIDQDLLSPLSWPQHPLSFTSFGIKALLPARSFVNHYFRNEKTKAFFYGVAAHSTLPLTNLASASFGLVLSTLAHKSGWPFPKGGAQNIANSLVNYYTSLGGKLHLNFPVSHLEELPKARAYVFDLTPKQFMAIGGTRFPWLYRKRMENFRYGAGVFKIDWALHNPIPFKNERCRKAGTIHIGNTTHKIEISEKLIHENKTVKEPYVLLAQHSVFDESRAPTGKHTAWAYCHVPNGNTEDMGMAIEQQVEKFAPGFRDSIMAKATHNSKQLEVFDPNLVGGDVNGGMQDISQLFTRPIARLSPYSTPNPKIYLCSASTPPGGGVHGMGGYNAAQRILKDHFPELM